MNNVSLHTLGHTYADIYILLCFLYIGVILYVELASMTPHVPIPTYILIIILLYHNYRSDLTCTCTSTDPKIIQSAPLLQVVLTIVLVEVVHEGESTLCVFCMKGN